MKTLDQIPPTWDQVIPNAADRFKLVMDTCPGSTPPCFAAVLDKETGLIWEKSPDTSMRTWDIAGGYCLNKAVGGRKGWRLPTIEELTSLMDPSVPPGPTLSAGHPFVNVQPAGYWSASTHATDTLIAWLVDIYYGNIFPYYKWNDTNVFAWCVRGGRGHDGHGQ
jgi:uncharacterized protein DUF1566